MRISGINRKMLFFNSKNSKSRHVQRIVGVYLIILLFSVCFFGFYVPVHAEEGYDKLKVKIPFYCDTVDNNPDMIYVIHLQGLGENLPQPMKDSLQVKGGESGVFVIEITEPGTFVYRMTQTKGTQANMVYDDKKYDAYIYVTNAGGSKLDYTVSITLADSSEKPESVDYHNHPDESGDPPSEDTKPSGEDGGGGPGGGSGGNGGRLIPGGRFSSRTGENTWLYATIFAGVLVLLAIGAVTYVVIKNRKYKEEGQKPADNTEKQDE